LYALADDIERVEGVTGVCGETPTVVALPSCALVAGWIDERPTVDRASLTTQDAVVRRVHALAPAVLPVRFGTAFADVEAAARAIVALGGLVADRLDLVRNREQMTLRVAGPPSRPAAASARSRRSSLESERAEADASAASSASDASAGGAGRLYLEQRAAQRLPLKLQRFAEALAHFERAVRAESGAKPGVVTMYHLIDRGASAEYIEAANRVARDLSELTLRVSGPSPAYAFADLGRLR